MIDKYNDTTSLDNRLSYSTGTQWTDLNEL